MGIEFNLASGLSNFNDSTKLLLLDMTNTITYKMVPVYWSAKGGETYFTYAEASGYSEDSAGCLFTVNAEDDAVISLGLEMGAISTTKATTTLTMNTHLQEHTVKYTDHYFSSYSATGEVIWSADAFLYAPKLVQTLKITSANIGTTSATPVTYTSTSGKKLYVVSPIVDVVYVGDSDSMIPESAIRVKWSNDGRTVSAYITTGSEMMHYRILETYGYIPLYIVEY